MIDITAEINSVREEQWGSRLRGSIADGLEKLAKGAADAGAVSLAQLKAEEAYEAATSAKTDAQSAKNTAESMQTQLGTVKADVETLKDGGIQKESATIYVDSEMGNDENAGTTYGTAFQTLGKALQVAKQYQMATVMLTAGQTFSANETVSGIGTGVILWGNNIDFRSTSNTEKAVINANVCALLGTGTFICVQMNGFFTATRSDITMRNCKAEDLTVSAGTTVSMKNCELASISCDFSEMRMASCTIENAIADNCSMVYMDRATAVANKMTDNGGMFYINGIPEIQGG
ncbi:MAG: hypothetical protein Q4D37_05775 [Oscillospiraceae bacterium]|nr:hypothetical protein [Oscillospiraceae bacterium]